MKVALLVAVAALQTIGAATATEPALDPAAIAAITRDIGTEIRRQHLPGLQIAVLEDGKTSWSGCFGVADLATGRPVDPSTGFRIGSITKLFTALAIMQLRDAGRLDLDDRVTRYLPWFRLAEDEHPTITIRELLLHLGGLAREPVGASWSDEVMPDRATLERDMAEETAALPPDAQWKYSNLGYAVLGRIVETVSGQSFADYLGARILRPLGLTQTDIEPTRADRNFATGYDIPDDGVRAPKAFLPMGAVTAAGGIVSTASDLARFAGWMLERGDGPVLGAQSRREMLRTQAQPSDRSMAQGIGFEIRQAEGAVLIGHGGRAGGFAARLDVDPAARTGVVLLTNADDAVLLPLEERILHRLAPAPIAAPIPPTDPDWSRYLGTYHSRHGRSGIAIVDGRLAWFDPSDGIASRHIFLDPAGQDRFRFLSGLLIGEILTFTRGPDGAVTAMRAAGNTDVKDTPP